MPVEISIGAFLLGVYLSFVVGMIVGMALARPLDLDSED